MFNGFTLHKAFADGQRVGLPEGRWTPRSWVQWLQHAPACGRVREFYRSLGSVRNGVGLYLLWLVSDAREGSVCFSLGWTLWTQTVFFFLYSLCFCLCIIRHSLKRPCSFLYCVLPMLHWEQGHGRRRPKEGRWWMDGTVRTVCVCVFSEKCLHFPSIMPLRRQPGKKWEKLSAWGCTGQREIYSIITLGCPPRNDPTTVEVLL